MLNTINSIDPIIIIQARMGSTRLPGKSMMLINNKPLLAYLVDTVSFVFKNSPIIIATSELPENEVIRQFALKRNIQVISGSELNVASRFKTAIEAFPNYQYFMRLCGDSPFFDVELLKKGKDSLEHKFGYDFITSKFQEGYPMGSNLEIIKSQVFLSEFDKFSKPGHFEHVTPYFYENFEKFTSLVYICENPKSKELKYKLSVDTFEDFKQAEKLLEEMEYQPWKFSLEQKFNLIERCQKP